MSRYIEVDAMMEELQEHADSLDEEVESARKNSKNYTNDFLEAVSGMADGVRDAMALIYEAPSIDIVRCAECRHSFINENHPQKARICGLTKCVEQLKMIGTVLTEKGASRERSNNESAVIFR